MAVPIQTLDLSNVYDRMKIYVNTIRSDKLLMLSCQTHNETLLLEP